MACMFSIRLVEIVLEAELFMCPFGVAYFFSECLHCHQQGVRHCRDVMTECCLSRAMFVDSPGRNCSGG